MATDVDEVVRQALSSSRIEWVSDVSGGIVNAGNAKVYEVDTGKIFVKCNTTQQGRKMFECEQQSLLDIAATNTVRVPQPKKLVNGPGDKGVTLICEYLCDLHPIKSEATWIELGRHIARLHSHNPDLLTNTYAKAAYVTNKEDGALLEGVRAFGYRAAHFFGPEFHIPADTWEDTWQDYFSRHIFDRLIRACEERHGDRILSEQWSCLSLHIHKPFTAVEIKPSLLHADLFDINVGNVDGTPVVFDPQSFYGHAEFEGCGDLPESFRVGYDSIRPPNSQGAAQRGRLYDLFVHILLYYCRVDVVENRDKALYLFSVLIKELE